MANFIDITGQRFGKLTTISYNKNNRKWFCQCECGNTVEVVGYNLRNGHTKSCGCLRHKTAYNKIDMVNQKIGRVLVLREIGYDSKQHDTFWECLCDCGTIFITGGNGLRSGKCQSCGCYCKDRIIETHKINMVGKTFGKLKVLEEMPKDGKKIKYKCLCECGNITNVIGEDLRSGHTQSCGCLKSKGEDIIANLLRQNNILFETEKTFPTCRFPHNNYHARFDFWVNNEYLIEYDGIQHFNIPNKWDTYENYEDRQLRDNFKSKWCKDNCIPLIRIPYYQLSYLKIEDLLLNTTNFKEN